MKFQFVHNNRSCFPVKKMCHALHISTSGYYAWRKRAPSRRTQENIRVQTRIAELFAEHDGAIGSPMMTADLRSEKEFSTISRPRVARHMRQMGLKCRTTRKYVVTTDSKHNEPVAANLLKRQFAVNVPNTAWVSDITYLKVGRRWHYLTVFIDLFSRMIVGWDISDSLERHSVLKAFQKAILRRRPAAGLLVHSDRGIQYASRDFRDVLAWYGCVQSMSRKGNCWDNAVAESFFHTLKTQFVRYQKFSTTYEAELALFRYIEVYYNRRRRHSTNGWMSPANFEQCQVISKVA